MHFDVQFYITMWSEGKNLLLGYKNNVCYRVIRIRKI